MYGKKEDTLELSEVSSYILKFIKNALLLLLPCRRSSMSKAHALILISFRVSQTENYLLF